jgi:hypothetical protein
MFQAAVVSGIGEKRRRQRQRKPEGGREKAAVSGDVEKE